MDANGFDALVRSWARGSRRDSLRWLSGGALGGALTWLGAEESGAKDKKKPKKKKKKPCGGRCPKGFYCCTGGALGARCCPYALGQCCPFACCVNDPNMVCGNSESSPCVYSAGAGPA
jgi:hypothetical protein